MPAASASAVTQLGLGGWPGQRYASFAGRSPAAPIPGDLITTEDAYFRRTATGLDAIFRRTLSGEDATYRRTGTAADTER